MSKEVKIEAIPVIDLFAGPGGLSEGFSSLRNPANGKRIFNVAMSIEKDLQAVQTLRTRALFRQLADSAGDYAKALKETLRLRARGELSHERIFDFHPESPLSLRFKDRVIAATNHVKLMALGVEATTMEIKRVIKEQNLRRRCVVIGGPPCQAYSLVGRSRMVGERGRVEFETDHRHFLYKEYLNVLKEAEPMAFVMENVKGLLSATVAENSMFDAILKDLSSLNYQLFGLSAEDSDSHPLGKDGGKLLPTAESLLLRAELYGVPQARHRVIIVGIRKDLLEKGEARPPRKLRKRQKVKVSEIINGMPIIRSGVSDDSDDGEHWLRAVQKGIDAAKKVTGLAESAERLEKRMQAFWVDKKDARGGKYLNLKPSHAGRGSLRKWLRGYMSKGVVQHESRTHMSSDLARYFFLSLYASKFGHTPTLKDDKEFPRGLWPNHESVGKAFHDRFRVQLADKPATTVTSHISKDGHYFIHPNPFQCRALTVREAARIQTFPDDYIFEGNRTQQYHQVGNAVPPFLARQIGERIVEALGL